MGEGATQSFQWLPVPPWLAQSSLTSPSDALSGQNKVKHKKTRRPGQSKLCYMFAVLLPVIVMSDCQEE